MATDSWRNPADLPLDWMPLRRPAEKVGRNDPCPCGSGKKYKRCCEARDREREASPYAGMTMEEALGDPGRHGDPRIIEKIPEEQLAALDLAGLVPAQLLALMRRHIELQRWDDADQALDAYAERVPPPVPDAPPSADVPRADDARAELLRSLMLAEQFERAARQLGKVKTEGDPLFGAADVALAGLAEQHGALAALDQLLGVEIDHGPCMLEITDTLRSGGLPALALALSRAVCFEQLTDAELGLLGDDAESLRKDLGLPEHDAVVSAHFELLERIEEEAGRPDLLEEKSRQNAALLDKLRSQREQLRRLENERALAEGRAESGAHHGAGAAVESEQVDALKRKLDRLKSEIRAQQDERRELRQKLREGGAAEPASREATPEEPVEEEAGQALPGERPLRAVQFSDAFHRSLSGIEPRLGLKAQEQALRFAAYDEAIWHHAKKLADFDDLYSLRVGIHHRLLLRRSAEGGVEVRELVSRERHDAVVMRYRRG